MLIATESLCKHYLAGTGTATMILKDISVRIAAGEFVALMGPSGSGKSSLLNILGCLDTPSAGRYFLNGEDTASLSAEQLAYLRSRRIGFVFQGFNLLPRKSVVDNIALPLVYAGISKEERYERAHTLLGQVGLQTASARLPSQLSGGQQQRVAVARALINRPALLLADEPTGNLDSRTSHEIMAIFSRLHEEQGITIVLVTHDSDIARHAGRLIRMVDGRVEETLASLAA